MELGHRPELRQKVTLSPQVYQGLSILAMPVAELQVLVEAELLENPVLEVEEFEEVPEEPTEERDEKLEDERAWDEWLDQYEELDSSEPLVPRDPNVEEVDTDEFVGGALTFDDYLLGQVGMLDLDEGTANAARAIVGSLDADGFFRESIAEIAAIVQVSEDSARHALDVVQQLDPPGVGARNLGEALGIQMEYLGIEEPLLVKIVEEYLDDLAANHYRKVARALRVDENEVRRLADILRTLNPRPAGASRRDRLPAT